MNFHNLLIENIKLETPDTITIWFKIPDSIQEAFTFIPGQYLTIKVNIDGEEYRRAYSICSPLNAKNIAVSIKRLAGGLVSTYIHSNWKAGDFVDIGEPQGMFTLSLANSKRRSHYFIAAGSGITPVFSMLQTLLEEEPLSACYLLYGSRDENI